MLDSSSFSRLFLEHQKSGYRVTNHASLGVGTQIASCLNQSALLLQLGVWQLFLNTAFIPSASFESYPGVSQSRDEFNELSSTCCCHRSCLYSRSWITCCTKTYHSTAWDATTEQLKWRMPQDASAVEGREKKKTDTHLTSNGLVLLAKFGVGLCGLAQAFIFSICSHLRSKGCACLWEALSFCLVMSALSRKTSPCFSSVQGLTHTHIHKLYWRWLITIATLDVIYVTASI